jgi:hypothetical protein
MKNRLAILFPILLLFSVFACSNENPAPSGPVQRLRGKVAVSNGSNYIIQLVQYTHKRGDFQKTIQLGRNLNPGFSFYLRNALDSNGGDIFEGGDIVQVQFRTLENSPDEPDQPLFQNTVELTVNGSQMIHVKDGGDYSISPE